MNTYFAGYKGKVPVVYCDDGMGLIWVSHKNIRAISTAHNIAKVWNAYERKNSRKIPGLK